MIGIVGEASKNSFVVFKGNSSWLNLDYSKRKNIIKRFAINIIQMVLSFFSLEMKKILFGIFTIKTAQVQNFAVMGQD